MDLKKNPSADLMKNSSLYFAIGLNVMLFLSWKALELKTYDKAEIAQGVLQVGNEFEEEIPITNINITPPPPPIASIAPEIITIVENEVEIEETMIESSEIGQDDEIAEQTIAVEEIEIIEEEEEISVPFMVVENVPIFPGCNGNNDALRKCFNSKMMEHVRKNFVYPDVAQELEIHGKVYVFFQIDTNGLVSNIKVRGPDKSLENEAKRIVSLLPKMVPGKQRGKAVKVPYSVPINFQIQQ